MGGIGSRCFPGFSTAYSNPLTERLERLAASTETGYRDSYFALLLGLATLHDAVDSTLDSDPTVAPRQVAAGVEQLRAANDHLSALGESLVRVRSQLFERDVDPAEPLVAREPFFTRLDYDALYDELASQGAALPQRAFWDEAASRMRTNGARGGFRLLERCVRDLQTDLHALIASVESSARLAGRALGEALHDKAIPIARVLTGYTRLLTTFGYVAFLCERAMHAYEQTARERAADRELVAS